MKTKIYAMMALTLSFVGSVFATQNQLYDANDNEFLLSMPIPPITAETTNCSTERSTRFSSLEE